MKVIYTCLEEDTTRYTFFSKEKELPPINPSDVLLQIKSCKMMNVQSDIIKELFVKNPHTEIPAALEVAGIVTRTGCSVISLHHGDRVAGLVPLTSQWSGCAEYCVVGEYDVVKLPDGVDYLPAVATLGDALHMYTALQYMAKLDVGEVVLILDGATSWGKLAVQLAVIWGAKVITVVSTLDEKSILEKLPSPPDNIINDGANTLISHVMEETGGLGADVIIDNGVHIYSNEDCSDFEMAKAYCPSKHDIISMLAVGGRWITSTPHLQLDPPDCNELLLRSATVSFLFSQSWMLCPSKQGKLQHILQDIFKKLKEKMIEVPCVDAISFKELHNSVDAGLVVQPGTLVKL